jgi:predicted GIY-YIG superfamily endonuclease
MGDEKARSPLFCLYDGQPNARSLRWHDEQPGPRVEEHKTGRTPGFTSDYRCERLVWFERYQYVRNAIAREKEIKNWTRAKKIALIEEQNPSWSDLSQS